KPLKDRRRAEARPAGCLSFENEAFEPPASRRPGFCEPGRARGRRLGRCTNQMSFDSEADDPSIALAVCGQGKGRRPLECVVIGNCKPSSRTARSKLRAHRQEVLSRVED
ncbi:MAG: hypothetical protein ACQEUZ_04625, partial [Pseudomonadota bacterium]